MPLKVVLKEGEKIIINGAVLESVGGALKALILNDAAVLREKDIITEKDASTPASRAYFALQNLYIFPHMRDDYKPMAKRLFEEYATAAPSAKELVDEILDDVEKGRYYQALRSSRKLVEHEGSVMGHAEQEFTTAIHEHADGGEPEADGGMGPDGSSPPDEGIPNGTG